jgi:predicted nucleic acid-binding protein
MVSHLVDTGILLRHIRRRPEFFALLEQFGREGDVCISSISRIEVLRGMRAHERERSYELLDSLLTHPLDVATANRAGELARTWQARGVTLGVPDVVIAASALELDATLVTLNPRHFPMRELRLLIADEAGRLSWPSTNGGT